MYLRNCSAVTSIVDRAKSRRIVRLSSGSSDLSRAASSGGDPVWTSIGPRKTASVCPAASIYQRRSPVGRSLINGCESAGKRSLSAQERKAHSAAEWTPASGSVWNSRAIVASSRSSETFWNLVARHSRETANQSGAERSLGVRNQLQQHFRMHASATEVVFRVGPQIEIRCRRQNFDERLRLTKFHQGHCRTRSPPGRTPPLGDRSGSRNRRPEFGGQRGLCRIAERFQSGQQHRVLPGLGLQHQIAQFARSVGHEISRGPAWPRDDRFEIALWPYKPCAAPGREPGATASATRSTCRRSWGPSLFRRSIGRKEKPRPATSARTEPVGRADRTPPVPRPHESGGWRETVRPTARSTSVVTTRDL